MIVACLALAAIAREAASQTPCEDGFAGGYPCNNVDLAAHVTPQELGGGEHATVSDMWGWVDPVTGREFALVGRTDGTAFVDVTDPLAPRYLGNLPTHDGRGATERDIKVYGDYAYIVSEGIGHGIQIFDLAQLRGITEADTLSATARYDSVASVHNIAINQETGFAYALGSNRGGTTCGGGLHMIDLADPIAPEFAGCFADLNTGGGGTGYTHDAQCIVYEGPDAAYVGREICFGSNVNAISIADVTDKQSPEAITHATYPTARFVHQGWLTADHAYFYQNDEGDEGRDARTMTIVWDISDLDDPRVITIHEHSTVGTDHNLFIRGNRLYQAHYDNGLRISDISDPGQIMELGYFDTVPDDDPYPFAGAWTAYPFFDSGAVLVSSHNGLFVLVPTGDAAVGVQGEAAQHPMPVAMAVTPNPMRESGVVTLRVDRETHLRVVVHDLLGREVRVLADGRFAPDAATEIPISRDGLPSGTYFVSARDGDAVTTTKFVAIN